MKKKVMEWWHSHRFKGNPYAAFVLMMLALDAEKDGRGYTSRRRLSRDTNLPESEVIDLIIDLEKLKLVSADVDEQGSIDYRLNLKKWGERPR